MEIIKQGTKNQVECNRCGSLLRYVQKDIFLVPTGYRRFTSHVKCPVCEGKVAIIVDSSTREAIQKRQRELDAYFDHNI